MNVAFFSQERPSGDVALCVWGSCRAASGGFYGQGRPRPDGLYTLRAYYKSVTDLTECGSREFTFFAAHVTRIVGNCNIAESPVFQYPRYRVFWGEGGPQGDKRAVGTPVPALRPRSRHRVVIPGKSARLPLMKARSSLLWLSRMPE